MRPVEVLCFQAGFDGREVMALLKEGRPVVLRETKMVLSSRDAAKKARLRAFIKRHPEVKVVD